jgi:hypothetical protein
MNLKEAVENKEALFLPGYYKDVPANWEYFINYLDYAYKHAEPDIAEEHKKSFMEGGRVRKGLLQIWGYMTMFAENPIPSFFPGLAGMIGKAESEFGRSIRSSFALLNFSNAENITNRHSDLTHNLYFQCVGSVTWRIYDDLNSDTYKEYDLVTGDAIWVPSGVSHEVIAKEPRTAITIAFEGNE